MRIRPSKRFNKVIKYPKRILWAIYMEGVDTRRMVNTFVKQGQGYLLMKDVSEKPTEEEMKEAMKQLKDIPRILPFFVFVIVPMPGMTQGYVLLAITLEKYLGNKISLLPDRFRKVFEKEEEKGDASKPPEIN